MSSQVAAPRRSGTASLIGRALLCAFVSVFGVSCGGSSPNSPSAINQIPNVAGSYTGPITWTANGTFIAALTMKMTVAQASSQLTLTGTISLGNQTFPMTAVTGNINATGFFTATAGGAASTSFDPTCGTIRGVDASLTFSGNSAQYVEHDSSQYCGSWTFSGSISR